MKKIELCCAKAVAFDSPDHLMPIGTALDNSRNWLFNAKMNRLVAARPLNILDIGCSGGGFVKSCLDQGHFAVGIEGSDYNKRGQRPEWTTIPAHLLPA